MAESHAISRTSTPLFISAHAIADETLCTIPSPFSFLFLVAPVFVCVFFTEEQMPLFGFVIIGNR